MTPAPATFAPHTLAWQDYVLLALCFAVSLGTGWWLAWRNVASLWDEFLKLTAPIGGGFPGVFAPGWLTKRANAPGVIIGALSSIVVTCWVQAHTATSAFLRAFVAIASCMAIGHAASWLCAARGTNETRRGLTLSDPH